jgi:ATP-dependent Zn protease
MVMKVDKKTNQNSRDQEELKIVAYHEADHALATKL